MRRAPRAVRLLAAAVLLASGGLAASSTPVQAVDVPVINPPPGGGPITEETVEFGPFQLDAYGGAHWQDEGANLVPRPEGAFGMKYSYFDLVDENGQPIGRHDVHLHHFVIGAVNEVDPACPDRTEMGLPVRPIVGSGMERTPIDFADPYAIEVPASQAWGAVWHLMNMSNTPRTVYVQYKLGVQRGATATNTRFLTPYFGDARGCPSGATWNVPGNGGPGAIETHSNLWTMPDDGIIVGIGGHLHDGGISITTKREDGTFLCENLATYAAGMLDTMSRCPMHEPIVGGERLSITSRYDNSAPHRDVMGMGVLFLWFGDQGTPPTTTPPTSVVPVVVDPAFTG